MRTLLWVAAWSTVALWSLLAWGAYGFFGLFTATIRTVGGGDVEGFPIEPFSAAWLMDLVQGLGGAVFFVVWATVAAFVLGTTWLLTALFTRRPVALPDPRQSDPMRPDGPAPTGRPGETSAEGGLFGRMDRFSREPRNPPRQ